MKTRINKKKRIGRVVFIVEGMNEEPKYLNHIFNEILGYKVQVKTRKDKVFTCYEGYDSNSTVTIINSEDNNLTSIKDANQFFKYVSDLEMEYGVKLKNSSTYYIFDRDPKNNKYGLFKNLASKLSASLNNNTDDINGLLLISFPSIESLVLNMTKKDSFLTEFGLGKDLKNEIIKENIDIDKLTEENLLLACDELGNYLKNVCNISIDKLSFDDLSKEQIEILEIEQTNYKKKNTFHCISEIVLALIDLQVIELYDDEAC